MKARDRPPHHDQLSCSYCISIREEGWIGDSRKSHCPTCGRTWTSEREAHCVRCHQHFASETAALHHTRYGPLDCVPPESLSAKRSRDVLVEKSTRWGPVWACATINSRFGQDLRRSDVGDEGG